MTPNAEVRLLEFKAAHFSLYGFGVFEGIVQRLAGVGSGLHHSPTVVVVAKCRGGTVLRVAGVERGAHFVQRLPSPDEVDVGDVALFADTGDGDQFPSGGRESE